MRFHSIVPVTIFPGIISLSFPMPRYSWFFICPSIMHASNSSSYGHDQNFLTHCKPMFKTVRMQIIYFKYFLEVIFFSHRAQQILGIWYWSITHKDVHIKTARALRTASTRIHMHTCNSPNHIRWHRGWCLRLWLYKICIIIMSTLC